MNVTSSTTPSSVASASGESSAPSVYTFDTDGLLEYCSTQMGNIDDEVNGYFAQAQTNDQIKGDVGNALSLVQALESKCSGNGGQVHDQTDIDTIVASLQQIGTEDPGAQTQINAAIQSLTTDAHGGTDDLVGTGDCQSVVSDLQSMSSELDSANQMATISLQSAMSRREQVIQLTTNMMQSVDDSETKVIDNIHS